MSSVANSVRKPGTCQLNGAVGTWLSSASGIVTVTPSWPDPGSKT